VITFPRESARNGEKFTLLQKKWSRFCTRAREALTGSRLWRLLRRVLEPDSGRTGPDADDVRGAPPLPVVHQAVHAGLPALDLDFERGSCRG